MRKVSILTIGDEICIGQIINTNAAWIAAECTQTGASVVLHSSVGDVKKLIVDELNRLLNSSDFVIITGGLGPTDDDLTKPVLCEFFNDSYVFHEELFIELEQRFKLRGLKLNQRNKDQALLPSKCKPLPNALGTAPGMLFETNGKFVVSLPGVPSEMIYIMNNSVIPLLQQLVSERDDGIVLYKNILTIGIPESSLADLLGPTESFIEGGTFAYLPSYKGVKLRIGVQAGNIEEGRGKIEKIESYIRTKAGKFIFGTDSDTLNGVLGELLKTNKKTVAVAESCTGGLLGGDFTEIPGSSAYFIGGMIVYSNEAKIEMLGVNPETIINFGAVSKETCEEMALNVRKKFNADFGISITGVAGPDGGTQDKPVGTVWIGLADGNGVSANKYYFGNDRKINRERAIGTAQNMLLKKLKGIA